MRDELTPSNAPDRTVPASRTAVIFLTHTLHEHVVERYEQLLDQLPPGHELLLALDCSSVDDPTLRRARWLAGPSLVEFSFSTVEAVVSDYPSPYPSVNDERLVPGNIDLLLLALRRSRPSYRRYWIVEYDVAFTGDWADLFRAFRSREAPLLGTTLHTYERAPHWSWWNELRAPAEIPRERWTRGFFPLLRLTDEGLDALDQAYRRGWGGHSEVVVPTALRQQGLKIEDIGGDGAFVRSGNENRFYTNTPERLGLGPGTFVYRPARRFPGLRRNKLWHPVKPTEGRLSPYLEIARDWFRARALE